MNELPVLIGGKEKIVGGLNRHTRCEGVIGILLQDRYKLSKCELSPQNLQCYALFEKWRGCERQLSPRTRMYKLWKAWGAERENVKFTLRKSVAMAKRRNSLDSEVEGGGIKLRDKAKRAANRAGQYNIKEGIVAYDMKKRKDGGGVSKDVKKEKRHPERRRSWADESDVGFTDVRILCPPPLDCDSSASTSSSSGKVTADGPTTLAEEVEGKTKLPIDQEDPDALIQTILKQSHQLHGLLETVGSIDREIEHFENSLHNHRIQKDGQNYVQESYLPGSSKDPRAADYRKGVDDIRKLTNSMKRAGRNDRDARRVPPTPNEMIEDLEEYLALCDRLFSVDDQLRQQQDAISNLSNELATHRTSPVPIQRIPPGHQTDEHPAGTSKTKPIPPPRRFAKKRVMFSPEVIHNCAAKDIGFARAELELSAETSVAQRKELDRLLEQIEDTEHAFKDKNERLLSLNDEMERLEMEESLARDTSRDDEDDEVRACVSEMSHSSPIDVRMRGNHYNKNSSLESSLDQGIGNDFSPIDLTNKKSPSRSCDSDSSSDTGLSSLHSQLDDSEQMTYNISETLV